MLVGGGIMPESKISAAGAVAKLFDFTATYMGTPPVPPREEEYPYSLLADEARRARVAHAGDPIPWVPYLAAGWNPRPWTHPQAAQWHRRFFQFPDRAQWTGELRGIATTWKSIRSSGCRWRTTGGKRFLPSMPGTSSARGEFSPPRKAKER